MNAPLPLPLPAAPAPRWALTLRRRAEMIAEAAVRARRGGDEDAIHDLRVGARRLEAALWLWRDGLGRASRRKALRLVRRVRRATGDARDLEVIVAELEKRLEGVPAEARESLEEWLAHLRDRRELASAQVATAARRRRVDRLLMRVERASGAHASARGNVMALAAARLAGLRERSARLFDEALFSAADRELHAARLAIKRRRYAEEAFAASADGELSARFPELRERQRALGVIQDRAALRDLLLAEADRVARAGDGPLAAALAALALPLEAERQRAIAALRASAPEPAPPR
jgi:CHAD domain-containing protein